MPDASSGDFITVREAYNTFVARNDLTTLKAMLDEHKAEDRATFNEVRETVNHTNEVLSSLRDEVRSGRLPKWAFWLIGVMVTIGVPFGVVALEHALK